MPNKKIQKFNSFFFHSTENGYKNVQCHVRGNLSNYTTKDIEKIKKTVAAILGCLPEEVLTVGYCPSTSFLVVLSMKDVFLSKLLKMGQSEKNEIRKLNIDYLIIDLFIYYVEPSKGKQLNCKTNY